MKFPRDAPVQRVVRALTALGFRLVRVGNYIAMERANADGSRTPLTMPNREAIKGSTLRAICTQAGINRDAFLEAYEAAQAVERAVRCDSPPPARGSPSRIALTDTSSAASSTSDSV